MHNEHVDKIAGAFLGIGLFMAFIPILLASLLVRENLFLILMDKMDEFWKSRKQPLA